MCCLQYKDFQFKSQMNLNKNNGKHIQHLQNKTNKQKKSSIIFSSDKEYFRGKSITRNKEGYFYSDKRISS